MSDDYWKNLACSTDSDGKGYLYKDRVHELEQRVAELMAECRRLEGVKRLKSCPCYHTSPCNPRCTCIAGGSSRGCSRCCSYGSQDQQREIAEKLVMREQAEAALASLVSEMKAIDTLVGRSSYDSRSTLTAVDDKLASLQGKLQQKAVLENAVGLDAAWEVAKLNDAENVTLREQLAAQTTQMERMRAFCRTVTEMIESTGALDDYPLEQYPGVEALLKEAKALADTPGEG